jgi:hypothetical protein
MTIHLISLVYGTKRSVLNRSTLECKMASDEVKYRDIRGD